MGTPTHDMNNRPYAKLSETKPGDFLEADGGFTCLTKGTKYCVCSHRDGPFINCADGQHDLRGQADDGEHLIGLYPVPTNLKQVP